MLSERDQSETNNALRVLFRYCYTTQVRSQILAPRLNPLFYFISLLSFFLTVSFTPKKRSLLVPLGGCWGWGGSAQRTIGKEKEGELLPFLPSSLTHFFWGGDYFHFIFGMRVRVSASGLVSFIIAYALETSESDVKKTHGTDQKLNRENRMSKQ